MNPYDAVAQLVHASRPVGVDLGYRTRRLVGGLQLSGVQRLVPADAAAIGHLGAPGWVRRLLVGGAEWRFTERFEALDGGNEPGEDALLVAAESLLAREEDILDVLGAPADPLALAGIQSTLDRLIATVEGLEPMPAVMSRHDAATRLPWARREAEKWLDREGLTVEADGRRVVLASVLKQRLTPASPASTSNDLKTRRKRRQRLSGLSATPGRLKLD
jgi:hypothetical protein